MLIYNVTTKVDQSIADEWVDWMQQVHIPAVMASGYFEKSQLLRLLEVDEEEGPTYAIQYFAESKSLYNLYVDKYADEMRRRSFEKWGDRFIAFRSVMQIVD